MNTRSDSAIDSAPAWSLVPLEEQDQMSSGASLPCVPTVADILAQPIVQLHELGGVALHNEDPMRLKKVKQGPVQKLSQLLQELVPMIDSFRNPTTRRQSWWRRFTGEELEREVTYLHACEQLENKADLAKKLTQEVEISRLRLREEAEAIRQKASWLSELVANGREALDEKYARERDHAIFGSYPDYWARFGRRIDNLNALQHAHLLSAEQFNLADAHAQGVLDRHAEIVTILVPLWRQRMGFELYSRIVTQQPDIREKA